MRAHPTEGGLSHFTTVNPTRRLEALCQKPQGETVKRIKSFLFVLAQLVALGVVVTAEAAYSSDVDRLLELLLKKHVVTEDEAAALRSEFRQEPRQGQLPPQTQGSVPKKVPGPSQVDVTSNSGGNPADKPSPQVPREDALLSHIPLRISGYVQSRWTAAPGTNDPLEMRRARLSLDGDLAKKISYQIQADAIRSPELLDARVDFNYLKWARVTVGQFKIPFSQESLVSSRDLIPIERSLVVNSLVPGRDNGSNGRDIGAQVGGTFFHRGGMPLLDYAVGIFNGAGINKRDDNHRKDGSARVAIYAFRGVSFAGDYYNGATGPKEVGKERAAAEFACVRASASLRGEFIWGRDGPIHERGWYTQFAFRFRPRWEGLIRFDRFDPNRHAPGDATDTYLGGVNWNLSRYGKLQANYGLQDDATHGHLKSIFLSQVQFRFSSKSD